MYIFGFKRGVRFLRSVLLRVYMVATHLNVLAPDAHRTEIPLRKGRIAPSKRDGAVEKGEGGKGPKIEMDRTKPLTTVRTRIYECAFSPIIKSRHRKMFQLINLTLRTGPRPLLPWFTRTCKTHSSRTTPFSVRGSPGPASRSPLPRRLNRIIIEIIHYR